MNQDWDDALKEFKMNETTTTFAASLISKMLNEDDREKILPVFFAISDYELEFLSSYTMHLVDMLATADKANESGDTPAELEIDDLIDYTLQHMGIDGHIK